MKTTNHRKYTEAFRAEAVSQVLEGGRQQAAVARSLEISVKTLANWVGKARGGKSLTKGTRAPVGEVEAELSRLRQENARLRMERDILKKAAAYFAKESM
jgi:transposase